MRRLTTCELLASRVWTERRTVVFLSDFGTADGAVSAMHGVANAVSPALGLYDLTHDVPQFNIWEASSPRPEPAVLGSRHGLRLCR